MLIMIKNDQKVKALGNFKCAYLLSRFIKWTSMLLDLTE